MLLQRVLLIFTILVGALWLGNNLIERFGGTSPGTLLQLAAQGPQDLYLTGPSGYGYGYDDYGDTYGGYGYYGYPRSLPYGRAPREGYYQYGYPTGTYGYYGYGLYPTYSGYKYGYLNPGYPYYGGY